MVEIFSRRDGPRREDVTIRRLIEDNRATIGRIADHISQGAYSRRGMSRPAPEAEGLIIHVGRGTPAADEPQPYIRINVNGRVSAVDGYTGRQIHHLGELRSRDGARRFLLATKANGFFAPVDDGVSQRLRQLDGVAIDAGFPEDRLIAAITVLLGYAREPIGHRSIPSTEGSGPPG